MSSTEIGDDAFRHDTGEVKPFVRRDHGPEVAGPRVHDGTPEVAGPRVHDGSPEVARRDSLEAFIARLTALDATLDEVEMVRTYWSQPIEPGDHTRESLLRMTDDELRALIADGRAEFEQGTLDDDQQKAVDWHRSVDAERPEAENQTTHGTVEQVREWVGTNGARAQAALDGERSIPDHEARTTLVTPLEALVASFWPDGVPERPTT